MIQKALSAPSWLTSGGVYQINPRTFSAEGTIAAVTRELPFLAELGFGTIYLCPIFEEDASDPGFLGGRTGTHLRHQARCLPHP